MNHRPERLESLIQSELSKIIAKEVEFDGFLATVVSVAVSKKIDQAKIGVSVFPSEKAEEALRILSGRQPYLQRLLAGKMKIKSIPKIFFEIDRGSEKAAEVEKLLIKEENKKIAR